MADEIQTQLETVVLQPKSVSADGLSVTQQTVDDLIKADQYTKKNDAVSLPRRGLRTSKIVPGGSV